MARLRGRPLTEEEMASVQAGIRFATRPRQAVAEAVAMTLVVLRIDAAALAEVEGSPTEAGPPFAIPQAQHAQITTAIRDRAASLEGNEAAEEAVEVWTKFGPARYTP